MKIRLNYKPKFTIIIGVIIMLIGDSILILHGTVYAKILYILVILLIMIWLAFSVKINK